MLGSRRSAAGFQLRQDLLHKATRRTESLVVKPDHRCEPSCSEAARILAVERQVKGCVAAARKPAEGLATEAVP